MSLFYAYVDSLYYRWVFAFESRATADKWWRKIDDNPNNQTPKLTRIPPQLYRIDTYMTDVPSFINKIVIEDKITGAALLKTFILIPPMIITDHISGGTIRIKGSNANGKVMIGSDDIQIALAFGDLKVYTNRDGILAVGKDSETAYKFGDPTGGFLVAGEMGLDACTEVSDKICQTDQGGIWELTN
ncbi:hypothetical protein F5Y19DRAFT_476609 [Xylariaceae sp. FL1651]|nr:hypothetical protein F5Y19DRAFT_476609 [Xylariaceae sp. FL1651]